MGSFAETLTPPARHDMTWKDIFSVLGGIVVGFLTFLGVVMSARRAREGLMSSKALETTTNWQTTLLTQVEHNSNSIMLVQEALDKERIARRNLEDRLEEEKDMSRSLQSQVLALTSQVTLMTSERDVLKTKYDLLLGEMQEQINGIHGNRDEITT